VVVRYKQPYAPALESWGQGIIPKHLLENVADINTAAFNRSPVGTGPYKFVRWKDKQFIELAANADYYEGKPHIARYVFKFIPEQSTQFLELKAGSIDTMSLTPDQFLKQAEDADFKRVARKDRITGYKRYSYLGFNLKREIFQDLRVRRALSHAIDRQALIDGVLLGFGKPCSGPYVPVMPAYNPEVTPVPLDLTKSAALLDEAGWKAGKDGTRMKGGKPLAFRLLVSQGSETGKKIVLILQQQFAKLGVKAELESYEWSTFINDHVNTRNFDAVVMAWNLSLDPDQYSIWHSSQTKPSEFNFVSYSNPEVDRILEKGRVSFDPAARTALYRRMHKLIAADQPYCFLFAQDSLSALSLKVQGVKMTPTGYGWGWYRDWYIPASLAR
jgi:peptide/nickel transport system substrate-binding protein